MDQIEMKQFQTYRFPMPNPRRRYKRLYKSPLQQKIDDAMLPAIRGRNLETEIMEWVIYWAFGLTPEDGGMRMPY